MYISYFNRIYFTDYDSSMLYAHITSYYTCTLCYTEYKSTSSTAQGGDPCSHLNSFGKFDFFLTNSAGNKRQLIAPHANVEFQVLSTTLESSKAEEVVAVRPETWSCSLIGTIPLIVP